MVLWGRGGIGRKECGGEECEKGGRMAGVGEWEGLGRTIMREGNCRRVR